MPHRIDLHLPWPTRISAGDRGTVDNPARGRSSGRPESAATAWGHAKGHFAEPAARSCPSMTGKDLNRAVGLGGTRPVPTDTTPDSRDCVMWRLG